MLKPNLALPTVTQPSLEIVDELPTRGYDDMDLYAPLWEHGANEGEYENADEGVEMEGIYMSKVPSKRVTLCAYKLILSSRVILTMI
jgi:hypothetical protein